MDLAAFPAVDHLLPCWRHVDALRDQAGSRQQGSNNRKSRPQPKHTIKNGVTRRRLRGRPDFGTVSQFQAAVRDISTALRYFRRNPGFFAVSVVNLALGIGATTAVFSVAAALLLRPRPYPDSDRLVTLRSGETVSDHPVTRVPPGLLADPQDRAKS